MALEYEVYPGMAEKELNALARETARRYPVHGLVCQHRTGRVAVGEIALQVLIRSRHRAEGFEALAWFILELKKKVPIWKWAVAPDGSRIPSPDRENEVPGAGERGTGYGGLEGRPRRK